MLNVSAAMAVVVIPIEYWYRYCTQKWVKNDQIHLARTSFEDFHCFEGIEVATWQFVFILNMCERAPGMLDWVSHQENSDEG